ncbi:MAG: Ni/Fe-hydrogenase, b-type cytochrome subunit [Dehalococcoidia bacterium]
MAVQIEQRAATEGQLERVYVWELPVRLVHWTIVATLIVLSFTGYYLHDPFLEPARTGDSFLFATMRFIHELTAFVFTAAVAVRVYWALVGNRYASWRGLLPLNRDWWRGLGAMLRYYVFLRRDPPAAIGHNPLASVAYLLVYVLFALQILTGFALYAWLLGTDPWTTMFGWVYWTFPIQQIRLYHFLLMFIFGAFTIHHVYSSVLVDSEERNGLITSIVSGYKFVARRTHGLQAAASGEPRSKGE